MRRASYGLSFACATPDECCVRSAAPALQWPYSLARSLVP